MWQNVAESHLIRACRARWTVRAHGSNLSCDRYKVYGCFQHCLRISMSLYVMIASSGGAGSVNVLSPPLLRMNSIESYGYDWGGWITSTYGLVTHDAQEGTLFRNRKILLRAASCWALPHVVVGKQTMSITSCLLPYVQFQLDWLSATPSPSSCSMIGLAVRCFFSGADCYVKDQCETINA